MECVLILKILFVGDLVDFVMSEFECIVGAVEVSADDGGLDGALQDSFVSNT